VKRPTVLRHAGILTHWRDYPEGSVERAKALGLEVLFTFQRVETTQHLWESKTQLVEQEKPWVALGLPSRAAFIKAITGHSEKAVHSKFRKSDAIRQRREEHPNETQQQTATAVGCTQGLVSVIINDKIINNHRNPLKRLQYWWGKASPTDRDEFLRLVVPHETERPDVVDRPLAEIDRLHGHDA